MSLQRLILMRHGKAEQRSASGEDFDRGLIERGRTDSRHTAAWLAEHGFAPELALVSPARRTVETWDEVASAFPDAQIDKVRELYNAPASEILHQATTAGAASVIVIGHNPGMHTAAFDLVCRGVADQKVMRQIREGFPTAAAAVFRFDDGKIVCEGLVTRRDAE